MSQEAANNLKLARIGQPCNAGGGGFVVDNDAAARALARVLPPNRCPGSNSAILTRLRKLDKACFAIDSVNDLFSRGVVAAVSGKVREAVAVVEKLQCEGHTNAFVTMLSKRMKVNNRNASGHSQEAIKRGFLHNAENKTGCPEKLVIDAPLPNDDDLIRPSTTAMKHALREGTGRIHPSRDDSHVASP